MHGKIKKERRGHMKMITAFKKGFLLGFILLWTSLSLAFAGNEQCLVSFKPEPSSLFQGGIAKIEFKVANDCLLKRISFGQKTVPFKQDEKTKEFVALVGVGLKEKEKKKPITFYFLKNGTHFKVSKDIPIKKKQYKAEYLKVKKKMVSFSKNTLKRVLDDQKALREVCSKIRPVIYWQGGFIWPIKSKILSPFGLRRYFNGQPRSPHSGIDLRAKENTPIKSPNHGLVVLVRNCYLSGNTVVIDHGGGLYTLYAHLSKVKVKQGQMVDKGQIIGFSGSTGRITGPHLHWGVSLLGQRVDPAMLMQLLGDDTV